VHPAASHVAGELGGYTAIDLIGNVSNPSMPSRGADTQPMNHHDRKDQRSRPGTARCRMPLPDHGGHGRVHGRSRIL